LRKFLIATVVAVLTVGVSAGTATAARRHPARTVAVSPHWRSVLYEPFWKDFREGQFPGPYGKELLTYTDGTLDTSHAGRYDRKTVSAAHGMLRLALYTDARGPVGSAVIIDPTRTGDWVGARYQRVEIRWRSDSLPGFGQAWMLYPTSPQFSWNAAGEIDGPESALNGKVGVFVHQPGNARSNALAASSPVIFGDGKWHTMITEWSPAGVTFTLDGTQVGHTSVSPSVPFRLTLQQATRNATRPDPKVRGHIWIDRVQVWDWQ
jgi:hypothetical protein